MSLSNDYPEYQECSGFLTREEIDRCVVSQSDYEKEAKGMMLTARRSRNLPELIYLCRRLYRLGVVVTPHLLEESRALEMS